ISGEQCRLRPVHLVHRRAGDVARGMRGHLEVSDVDVVPEVDRSVPPPCGPQVSVIEGGVEAFRVRDLQGVRQEEVRHVRGRRQRIARAIRRRPRRIIAALSTRSDPKNRSANRLIRTPSARGPPTADRHRDSYASSGVPSRRWSAAVSPAYRPAIIATLFPPPFVAMTMPAASPTNMTLSFTVRGGGPSTGTKPPVALPGTRRRFVTNLSNRSRRFPRNRSQVPR